MIRRLFAAALGVLLGIACIGPIQASRLMAAICSGDKATLNAQLNPIGIGPQVVNRVSAYRERNEITCLDNGVRGFYLDKDGNLTWVAWTNDSNGVAIVYMLTYTPDGTLQTLE